MSRNYGNATLKNHIAKAAPGTLAAMGQMFGISQMISLPLSTATQEPSRKSQTWADFHKSLVTT
jgi:phage tail protein X